jgi:chromosome segregation ATPase
LVTNAQTIDSQLTGLRSSLDTAKAAQAETEKSLQRATAERGEATAKVVELQKKLDDIGRSADERQTALDRAIRRTSLSEDASARYRKERDTLRSDLAEARSAESTALGKVIGLQKKLDNIDRTAAASRAALKEEKTLRAFAEGTADRCKRELEGVKEKLRSAEAKVQDVEKLRAELNKERAEHETKSKELDRWKASIAALQGA